MIQLRMRRGVHPPEGKLSAGKPIEEFPVPKQVVIPLSQHAGKPATPLVKKRQKVKTGEKIGEASGFISAPVHSSVTGTVKTLETVLLPNGSSALAAIIAVDEGEEEWAEPTWPMKDLSALTPEDLRTITREAGIVGLGGAVFPTSVKISPPKEYPIDSVIVNGAECEPYLTSDHRLMLEHTQEIFQAAQLLKMTVGAKRGYIAIEDNKRDAAEAFENLVKGVGDWEVVLLKTRYPQGAEKSLIKVILGREVPMGGLPFHVGALVQNVGTLYAIYEAAARGIPLIRRVVTVTGEGVKNPSNFLTRIGTSAAELLQAAGADLEAARKIVFGGPMMGMAVKAPEIPVLKSTSGILVLSSVKKKKVFPCLYCGKCVYACPLGITTTRLVKYIQAGMWDQAKAFGLFNCMECGVCSYVCPANIPLVHWIRYGKFMVRMMEAKQ